MTLQAASQFSLPSTPHSPHSPHSNSTSSTSGNSTSPTLTGTNVRSIHRYVQQGASSYQLLSASIFLVRAYHHTSASRLCFAQISRVSLSFIITSCMMTSCDYFFGRQRTTSFNRRQPALSLSVGQALPVSRFACAHCCCCCCTSAHVGGGPSSTTNERRLSPFFSFFFEHANKLIYEEGVLYSSPRFRTCTDFSVILSSAKCKIFLGNYFE